MKIVADENIPYAQLAFGPIGELVTLPGRTLNRSDLLDADILIVRSVTCVNRALLHNTPVRFVGTCTIGRDHIDNDYLEQQGIAFTDAAGCNANAVAEYVVTALLAGLSQLNRSIFDARIGIVGFGNVGRALKRKLDALRLSPTTKTPESILVCDPPLQEEQKSNDTGSNSNTDNGIFSDIQWASLERVLRGSDIICFHTPLTDGGPYPTRNLINSDTLQYIQPETLLLNAGRGDIIDQEALLKRIYARNDINLILDVWQQEPMICDKLLDQTLYGTPHIAGYSWLGKVNGTALVAHALQKWLQRFLGDKKAPPLLCCPDNPTKRLNIDTLISAPLNTDESQKLPEPLPGLQQLLAKLTQSVYSIATDDQAIRKEIKAFDQLRRDYPTRLEWSQVKLSGLDAIPKDWAKIVTELGFGTELPRY